MNEASKTRAVWSEAEKKIFVGKGIDIGCGNDPINPSVEKFDVGDGDANEITKYVKSEYDYVFASHCLEHMKNPALTIKDWWKLVKPGGHLVIVVPDEDLYEQGYYPSLFNGDHKATFTISKKRSWSPVSYNLMELAQSLEKGEIVSIKLHDLNYDRRLINQGVYPRKVALFLLRLHNLMFLFLRRIKIKLSINFLAILFKYPVDQTLGDAMAQIQVIIKKESK